MPENTSELILSEIRALRREVAELRKNNFQRVESPDDWLTKDEAVSLWPGSRNSFDNALKWAAAAGIELKRCHGRIQRQSFEALRELKFQPRGAHHHDFAGLAKWVDFLLDALRSHALISNASTRRTGEPNP